MVSTNLTYERYKFFGRRQKDHESLEKFHETLLKLAMNCKLGELEKKTMHRVFNPRKRVILRTRQ